MSIFFMLVSINTYSQTDLTLNQAWEKAYQDYPELKEKNALINAAQYNTLKVKSSILPNTQVQWQNTYGTFEGSGGAFFPLPGIFNVNGNSPDTQIKTTANSFGSVLVDWNIYQFGRLRHSIRAANSLTEQARGEFTLSRLNVQTAVTRLYFNNLYSDAYLIWAKSNSDRVKKILEIATSLADAGIKPGADTSLASSSYLQALSRTDEWKGKLESAKLQLSEFIPDLGINTSLKTDFYLQTPMEPHRPDSVNNHPVLNVLAQEVIYGQIRQKEATSRLLPAVFLLGGASSRGSGIGPVGVSDHLKSGFENGSNNFLAGIGLTWSISDMYSGALDKKRIAQQTIAAQSRYDLRKIQLHIGIQSINANITEQIKQVSKSDAAVQKSKEAYELYFARYESGLINLTELLQIQLLLQEAEKSNIEAHRSLWDQVISRAAATSNFTYLSNQF